MSEPLLPSVLIRVRLALDRYELDVDTGTREQVTGIFGPSGSGKTSLLEAIAGLRRKARGRIELQGDVWLDSDARTFVRPEQRGIGYVPQDGLLFPNKTVRGNLLAGSKRALASGRSPGETLATVADLLELTPLLEQGVTTLSGGERQRVALGRAICSGPRLLLLDEPLASLDLPLRRKLLPFLRRVRSEFRIPMLLVSHDPIEVQALCDDLIVLREGRVVARGEPREVLTDPGVFPLAEMHGFENVLPCRFVGMRGSSSIVRLGTDEDPVDLVTVGAGGDTARTTLVGLPADEILIATERPRGLSARNVLPARIRDIRTAGPIGLVRAELSPGVPPLTIEITEMTTADLGLEADREIYLVVKAASCRLYEGDAD